LSVPPFADPFPTVRVAVLFPPLISFLPLLLLVVYIFPCKTALSAKISFFFSPCPKPNRSPRFVPQKRVPHPIPGSPFFDTPQNSFPPLWGPLLHPGPHHSHAPRPSSDALPFSIWPTCGRPPFAPFRQKPPALFQVPPAKTTFPLIQKSVR